MFAVVFLGLVAACAAAPQFFDDDFPFHRHGHPRHMDLGPRFRNSFTDNIFDTRRFWADLSTEMRELDTVLGDFYKAFPRITSTQGVDGDQYKVTIPLRGFQEKDVVVKARDGLLMVQAVHVMEDGGQRSYLDIKGLPSIVNVTGTWTYEDNVLKIVFPLKDGETVPRAPATEAAVTAAPATAAPATEDYRSREEMDAHGPTASPDVDADIGVDSHYKELSGPNIAVEATTYAVDLKDEVEFVPIRY